MKILKIIPIIILTSILLALRSKKKTNQMRNFISFLGLIIVITLISSCNKQDNKENIFTPISVNWMPNYLELQEFHNKGYTVINGTITIRDIDNINDLSLLSNVRRITGSLGFFDNLNLTSINGLQNLESVGGLWIGGLPYIHHYSNIRSLQGFNPNLKIERFLYITENQYLKELKGLDWITIVDFKVNIDNNDSIVSLSGLGNITNINSQFMITYNKNLTDLCAINDGVKSIQESYLFKVQGNKFNPSIDDFLAGNCSQ